MTTYKSMTAEELERYREARMTHGQRQQAWEDEQAAKRLIMAGLGVLFSALYLMAPLVEMLVIG